MDWFGRISASNKQLKKLPGILKEQMSVSVRRLNNPAEAGMLQYLVDRGIGYRSDRKCPRVKHAGTDVGIPEDFSFVASFVGCVAEKSAPKAEIETHPYPTGVSN